MESMQMVMLGAVVMACFMASVRFFKFWQLGRDRFFIWFGMAFATFGVSHTLRILMNDLHEHTYYVYVPRLVGFLLILFAIFEKNRLLKS